MIILFFCTGNAFQKTIRWLNGHILYSEFEKETKIVLKYE